VKLNHYQDHQTWHAFADRKQDYSHAKFEKPCPNCVKEKANVKVFHAKSDQFCLNSIQEKGSHKFFTNPIQKLINYLS